MRQINFFCIGTQKGGTTTLHDILSQHPDLCLPAKKETHFFSNEKLFSKGEAFYLENFKGVENAKFLGEIDPEYAFFKESAKRIYDMYGQVKIVIILRDPVERAYSQYLMTKRRGLEDLDFQVAVEIEKGRLLEENEESHYSYISRGYYVDQVEAYEAYFGIENIKIVLFEDFIKNTDSIITDISNFVGLPAFKYNTDVKSNPASAPRFGVIQKFIYQDNVFKEAIGKFFGSDDSKRRIMQYVEKLNLKKAKKEKLSNDIKTKLYNKFYKDEILKLEQKLDLNLSHWKH